MAEMSAAQAAEILEEAARQAHQVLEAPTIFYDAKSMPGGIKTMQKCETAYTLAVSLCRKVVSGELREVKHAHWIFNGDYDSICSACGEDSPIDHEDEYNYCPQCGALMDAAERKDGTK